MSDRRSLSTLFASTFDLVTGDYLAPIGVVVSAIIIVVNFVTLNSYYIFSTVLAVLIGCALYAGLNRRTPAPLALSRPQLSALAENRAHKLLTTLFFGFLCVSIVLLHITVYSRPPLFFVLIALIAASLAIEIAVTSNVKHAPSILLKIIILAILVRASVYFEFPSAIVADPWWHSGFIQYILDHGYIPAQVAPYSSLEYIYMPMMHLLIAAVSLSTGIGLHNSYFFLGVIECISVVFIYLIGRAAVNERTGLLAALLLVLANQFIFWGVNITPLTLGIVLTLVVLVVLFLVPRNDLASFVVLLLVVLASVLLTHEGTAAYTAIVLVVTIVVFALIWLGARRATNGDETQNAKALTLHLWPLAAVVTSFVGALIGYWILIGGSAAQRLLAIVHTGAKPSNFVAQPLEAAPPAAVATSTAALHALSPSSLPLYNDLSTLLLILFATVGLLYLISRERKKTFTVAWTVFSALMLTITVVIYFAGGTEAIPERWIVYLQAFMVIPAAVAILALGTRVNARKGLAVIFSVVLILSFVGITNSYAKVVSELPWDQRPRIALMQSEVSAAETIANKTTGPIRTDFVYYWIFAFQLNSSNVTPFSSPLNGNGTLSNNTTLVLRGEIANNPYLIGGVAVQKLGADKYDFVTGTQDVVYDAGSVQAVIART
ncbi:MAG: glycosyltransferase family 39 protein [Halobacteriota archaeon]